MENYSICNWTIGIPVAAKIGFTVFKIMTIWPPGFNHCRHLWTSLAAVSAKRGKTLANKMKSTFDDGPW